MIRLQDQRHAPAFHLRVALDLAHRPEFGLDLVHQLAAEILVGHFAPLELQRELHLVSLFEKLAGVVDLDLQVVVADLDGLELQFLELAGPGTGP